MLLQKERKEKSQPVGLPKEKGKYLYFFQLSVEYHGKYLFQIRSYINLFTFYLRKKYLYEIREGYKY